MNYKIYKIKFDGPVHLGDGFLDTSKPSFSADTLFSALYIEALKYGQDSADEFLNLCKNDKVKFSDAFPFAKDKLYLPKPMIRIEDGEKKGISVEKKAYKKLQYVPVNEFDAYINGHFDVLQHGNETDVSVFDTRDSVFIRSGEDTEPYRVGFTRFKKDCGLYLIVAFSDDEHLNIFSKLLLSLQTSGIGGKRHSGYGRFSVECCDCPHMLQDRLTGNFEKFMALSVCLPNNEELQNALQGSFYSLCKKGGFVQSYTYAPQHLKKQNIYLFKAGSVFTNKFLGDIYDVATNAGTHPVFKYAKPLFLGVK